MDATGNGTTASGWTGGGNGGASGGADDSGDGLSDAALRDLILHGHALVFLPGPMHDDPAMMAES